MHNTPKLVQNNLHCIAEWGCCNAIIWYILYLKYVNIVVVTMCISRGFQNKTQIRRNIPQYSMDIAWQRGLKVICICTNVPINYISKAILSYITYDHTKTIHIQMPRVNSILQIKASFLKYNKIIKFQWWKFHDSHFWKPMDFSFLMHPNFMHVLSCIFV